MKSRIGRNGDEAHFGSNVVMHPRIVEGITRQNYRHLKQRMDDQRRQDAENEKPLTEKDNSHG